jgi:ATP-dependent DNA ligase
MTMPVKNEPMKAADLTNVADKSSPTLGLERFFTGRFIMERKVDGCRITIRLDHRGNKVFSRGRDVTDHFPHLEAACITGADGVELDGELLANGPDGRVLSAATPLLTSGTTKALERQKLFGPGWMVVFDILSLGPDPVSNLEQWSPGNRSAILEILIRTGTVNVWMWSYADRRKMLEMLMTDQGLLSAARFATEYEFEDDPRGGELAGIQLIESVPCTAENIDLFRNGEGFMIKDVQSKYIAGGRDGAGWYKFKWTSTCDAFIVGYKPGENSNKGLVGSVTVALVKDPADPFNFIEVATVGVFTQAERRSMSAEDGSLRPEYYGRVLSFACQGMGTQGMARHPRLVEWRPDKTAVDCTLDQLAAIPVV